MKKKKHKYKLKDKLEFKFYDGDIRQGFVTKLSYKKIAHDKYDYNDPCYTLSIKEIKRTWHYPSITNEMVLCKLR